MGEQLGRISFWTMVARASLLAFVPMFAGGLGEGQVIDAYKFFDRHRGQLLQPARLDRGPSSSPIGIILILINAIASRQRRGRAGHDPWGADSLEWFALSPPQPHNFDVLPDVRSARPLQDIRAAIAHRTAQRRGASRRASRSR